MAKFAVLKGMKLRATKVNSCGLPIDGPGNYVVTDGFVSVKLSPNMRDAKDIEQENAQGKVCITDRTPPERKWYDLELALCGVDTHLVTMLNGWPQEVDYDGNPVGYRDRKSVESDFGIALEVWTGGKSDDDCPAPSGDDIFANPTSGKSYGYLLTWGTEWTLGDLEIKADVADFTLSGISFAGPQWGRGPWNVVPIDSSGTAGRLITPTDDDQHYVFQRTSIAPPDATPGSEGCELDIAGTFTDPDFYFGGSGPGEDAADVAPDQPGCTVNP